VPGDACVAAVEALAACTSLRHLSVLPTTGEKFLGLHF
jgi:hypothetical protein